MSALSDFAYSPSTPPSAQWLRVQSSALTRLVCLELLTQDTLPLSAEMRTVLEQASKAADNGDKGTKSAPLPVLEHMGLWVDLAPLRAYAQLMDERSWDKAALIYCLRRQAHYPLLQELFPAVSRQDIQKLRGELGLKQASVHRHYISEPDADQIWQVWQEIQKQFLTPIEQWVQLAQRFQHLPLNALYQFLVIESR